VGKLFVSGNALYEDAFALARKIYDSDYRPSAIVGVWRGGTPVAITVHEALAYMGLKAEHYPLKAGSYSGSQRQHVVIEGGLDLPVSSSALIIDDVFDSGKTLDTIASALEPRVRDVRTAAIYYKPEKNVTKRVPDYFVHSVPASTWIVFPHEVEDLTLKEIAQGKGKTIAKLLDIKL
jgi:hypoxanthine phosphoribosyltransferase